MLGILFKNWKLILDIILVIALVVLLFLWNPFGIFGGGLSLSPTTNMVAEVKEMGQLVSSEYYGEVIASIEESRMNRIETEEISNQASHLYDNLYGAAEDLFDYQSQPLADREAEYKASEPVSNWRRIIRQGVNRRNILEKFNYHQFLEDLSEDPLYEDVLQYIWINENNNRPYNATSRQKEEALFLIYTDVENDRNQTLDALGFTEFYYQNKESQLTRKETRQKLAMVGRGWVKAGFDFSTMDDNMFYIDEDAGEVHFFGLSAVILNADINPWFIPEKGVPGFEILDYNGKVDFRDAKIVKQYCIDKLIVNAHRADILTHAEQQGAETLRNLFSLMSGKEYKKVFFHHDGIIQLTQVIAADELVNFQEATLLDSQIVQEIFIIDSLRNTRENSYKNQQQANHREQTIMVALAKLRQLPFQDMPGTFNYFSKFAFETAEDSVLDKFEQQQLEALRIEWPSINRIIPDREINRLKNFWFEDSLLYLGDYNMAIDFLLDQGVKAGNVEEQTLLESSFTPTFLEDNWVQSYFFTHSDSIRVNLVRKEREPEKVMLELLYPFDYNIDFREFLFSKNQLWLDSLPMELQMIDEVNDSTFWVYETNPRERLRRLNIPLEKLMNKSLLQNLRNKDMIWISENLCFIREAIPLQDLKSPNMELTERQSQEMEAYYRLMLESYEQRKNSGPVVRANEWMQKKFENNKSVKKWLSDLRNKIID